MWTALECESWLHFIIAFNLFTRMHHWWMGETLSKIASWYEPTTSFIVVHCQTSEKFLNESKSFEAKSWDIIIFPDLFSPLSFNFIFFCSILHFVVVVVLLAWDYFVCKTQPKIQCATCAILLFYSKAIPTYVTKICAIQWILEKKCVWTTKKRKKRCILCAISPKRTKNCSSFRIASIVRLSLFMHRADSHFGNDCTCSDVRHKTTISDGKIDLEFNWMVHAMRTDNNKNCRRGR